MELINPAGRSHRTALVVDGEAFDNNSTYNERVKRLVQSVNGPNIKVDIYVVRGDKLVRTSDEDVAATVAPVTQSVDASDPIALLREAGYDQILPSVPGK